MIKKIMLAAAFALAAFVAPAHGQGDTTKVRSAAALPAHCQAGGAGNAPVDTVIVNSVYYYCDATDHWASVRGLELANKWTASQAFKGPAPWADINAFGNSGFRPGVITPTDGSTTAICVAGSPNVTIGNEYQTAFYVNGTGVTLQNCGATNTMGTPSAPTVTPSYLSGGEGTHFVVNSPTGASTYRYKIVARDKYGALTAPSAATTITNGLATLGLIASNAISSASRSNDTVTINTSASLSLVAGMVLDIKAVPGRSFDSWYKVCNVITSTQFTICSTPIDSRNQTATSAEQTSAGSGGAFAYRVANALSWTALSGAWEYYVCAQRPGDGSYHVIGVTKPSDTYSGYNDVKFEDLGATDHSSQTYPYYVTDAICTGSATNDPLTSVIVSGGGTTSIVLANNAVNSSSGGKILFDAAPLISAAAASVTSVGTVHIPASPSSTTGYPINSFLQLPSGVHLEQVGKLILGETIETLGSVNWDGVRANAGTPQFGTNGSAAIQTVGASPALHLTHTGNVLSFLKVYGTTNGNTLVVTDNSSTELSHVNLDTATGSTSDYLGMAIVYRDASNTIADHKMDNSLITGGPDQVNDKSWTPLMWLAQCVAAGCNTQYDVQLKYVNFNIRGIQVSGAGNCPSLGTDWTYRQGGINPMVEFVGCGYNGVYKFNNMYRDSEDQPLIANLSAGVGLSFTLDGVFGGTNPGEPLISGYRPVSVQLNNYYDVANGATVLSPNRSIVQDHNFIWSNTYPFVTGGAASSPDPLRRISEPEAVVGGYSHYWVLPQPSSITATAASGGSIPVGTYVYSVSATGFDGGDTTLQAVPSAPVTTSAGTQKVNVGWTPTVGAVSYNIFRCNTSNPCSVGGVIGVDLGYWTRVAAHVGGPSTNTYADTSASTTSLYLPAFTGTGVSGMNDDGAWGPLFACPETTAPSGVAGWGVLFCNVATHRLSFINNNGSVDAVAGLSEVGSGVADTTFTNATTALSGNTCSASAATVTMTGVTTAMTFSITPSTDVSGSTGWGASGGLAIVPWPTANTLNYKICNQTSSSITPAAVTWNVSAR